MRRIRRAGRRTGRAAFCPPQFQGTPLRPEGAPILDMSPPPGVRPERQRANLDVLAQLNRLHRARHPEHAELEARIESYELAFRMQAEMPAVLDLAREDPRTLEMYGVGGAG